jgi:hypothetical protein
MDVPAWLALRRSGRRGRFIKVSAGEERRRTGSFATPAASRMVAPKTKGVSV